MQIELTKNIVYFSCQFWTKLMLFFFYPLLYVCILCIICKLQNKLKKWRKKAPQDIKLHTGLHTLQGLCTHNFQTDTHFPPRMFPKETQEKTFSIKSLKLIQFLGEQKFHKNIEKENILLHYHLNIPLYTYIHSYIPTLCRVVASHACKLCMNIIICM